MKIKLPHFSLFPLPSMEIQLVWEDPEGNPISPGSSPGGTCLVTSPREVPDRIKHIIHSTVNQIVLIRLVLKTSREPGKKGTNQTNQGLFSLFRPPPPGNGGLRARRGLFFPALGLGRTRGPGGSHSGGLPGGLLVGRGAVVLAQAHGAQRADGKTHLLSEAHQQPVDLSPQLPETATFPSKPTLGAI